MSYGSKDNRTVIVEESLWMKVKTKALIDKISVSKVIRSLLLMWIDGSVEVSIE